MSRKCIFLVFVVCILTSSCSSSSTRRDLNKKQEWASTNQPMTRGNLLITQPNALWTHQYLVEATEEGEWIQNFDLQSRIQPIDIAFHPRTTQLLVLDTAEGVFRVNQTGWVEGIWGEANSTYLPGGELLSMTFDHHANLLIINQNPSKNLNNRRPEIVKFNENGKYVGVVIPWSGLMGYPVGVAVDWDGNLWVALTNSIKKFSPVGQLLKSFNPHESHSEQYVGIVSSPYNGDIFVSALCRDRPDRILSINRRGEVQNVIELQGSVGGGKPSGMTFDDQRNIYVVNTDSDFLSTQYIQVYNIDTGLLTREFGGTMCGSIPPDFLCKPQRGISFVVS